MNLRRGVGWAVIALAVTVLVGGGVVAYDLGVIGPSPSAYERTTVTLVDDGGTTLATVEVRVADTSRKRYTGLSETESLAPGEGMLFVHDESGSHAYVMREMDFPLDIVFVAADGRVTAIRHASLPPPNASEGELKRYTGRGKYVLEVPRGYTNETGLDVGDRVEIDR